MATTLAVRDRQEIVNEMTPALQKVYRKILDMADKTAELQVKSAWTIGEMVNDVVTGERKYGEQAMDKLASALGGSLSTDFLYACQRIQERFTAEMITKLLERRMTDGGMITVSHLSRLTAVSKKEQNTLLEAVFQESLTVRDLQQRISASTQLANSGRGRPVLAPRTINSGLNQIHTLADNLVKRVPVWEESVFGKITEDSPPDTIDEHTVELLETAKNDIDSLFENGKKLQESLKQAKDRVRRVLSLRSQKNGSNGKAESSKPAAKKKAAPKPARSAKDRVAAAKASRKKGKKAAKKKTVAMPQPA